MPLDSSFSSTYDGEALGHSSSSKRFAKQKEFDPMDLSSAEQNQGAIQQHIRGVDVSLGICNNTINFHRFESKKE
jgi:hypothetical protein